MLGTNPPPHLEEANLHLNPDFDHLTYRDQGERAKQIKVRLNRGDLNVFHAGLRNVQPSPELFYALVGRNAVDAVVSASCMPESRWDENGMRTRARTSDWGRV
ncbi:MAG: hypothetical protein M1608_17545 [Candidatus Omnitrophica bacterium]|nr:hypothetical protein [Candidatus Omnitrophota bacterium]